MKFQHEAKSDIMALCQVIVEKYLKKKHGSFWIDYAEEKASFLTDASGEWLYDSFWLCDQCDDAIDHLLVQVMLSEEDNEISWVVFEPVDSDFFVSWEDINGRQ